MNHKGSKDTKRVRRAARVCVGVLFVVGWPAMMFAQERVPLIKRLDDVTRVKVLAALAGLIILGFAVVLLTWLGARVTQRYRRGSSYFRPTVRPGEHEWARKPMDGDEE